MYCPKCFNNTLKLSSKGVVNVVINGKQMDTGRFLFNLSNRKKDQITKDLEEKLEEFFEWYSSFQNREAINSIELSSGDFFCEEGCRLGLNSKFSVVDVLIPRKLLVTKLKALGEKYQMSIQLKSESQLYNPNQENGTRIHAIR